MKIKEIRLLSEQELTEKLQELNKQLMELQFKRRVGVEKPHSFKVIKKTIARINTVFNERKKEVENAKA